MKKIKSFTIDHDQHDVGFYLSGESHNIYTYDMRFKKPNQGDYLSFAALHTIEHIFATIARNSKIKEQVVYFGPMGCRTGFYFLLRDVDYDQASKLTIRILEDCLQEESIPGAAKKECGNYLEHNLDEAKREISKYLNSITAKQ